MSILLGSTSDLLSVVTGAAVTVDVHASYTDLNVSAGTVTPGRTNTAITTATTTTVIGSPGSGVVRKVKSLRVRNKHATLPVVVTINHTDGTTSVELDKRNLGPGSTILITEDGDIIPQSAGDSDSFSWYGVVAGAFSNGDPGKLFSAVQNNGVVSATPTNIGVAVARCSLFKLPFDLTVNRIRYYGVGATTNVFRVAIYRLSDLARLTDELPFSTAAVAWGSAGSALNLSLSKNVVYFIACSVNATGTTAGPVCMGPTIAATTGRIGTAPSDLPGSLAVGNYHLNDYSFQFPVTSGVLPDPASGLTAQATWTGGMPAFWLDSQDV